MLDRFGADEVGYKAAYSGGKGPSLKEARGREQADHSAFMGICFYQNRGLIEGQWEARARL